MVDCRPASGAPHEPHAAPNGAAPPPPENHHTPLQGGGSGDMGSHGVTSPCARASTPTAMPPQHVPYVQYQNPGMGAVNMGVGMGAAPPYVSYMMGGVGAAKGVVWVPPVLPPPPHHVNPHASKSLQANGADLPMNDIPTLRYYFNLGVDCMWAAYGPPPPPRHYSPRDITQDMQQMSLSERGGHATEGAGAGHKHKGAQDKPMQNNGKGNSQRSIMGPRFKRGNGQEGNPNPNHNQNKNHNNNNNHMANKGPNNRRSGSMGGGHVGYGHGEGEAAVNEAPMMTLPYIPYPPPPVYPLQYYPVETTDPGMMGMMGGMQYMGGGYEELEYPHYYPPPPFHPHAPPLLPPPHIEHK